MEALLAPAFAGGLLLLGLWTATWLLSLALRDASIADVVWGLSFVAVAGLWFVRTPAGWPPRKLLLLGLVALWGVRLSAHVFLRNRGQGEDRRYRRWREEAGPSWWWRSYFTVFLLQCILGGLIAAPLLAGQAAPASSDWGWLVLPGVSLWLLGFFFEVVGDWQLVRFKSDPANRGRLLTTGLWRYTRHPNYFGEAVLWWGLWLVAASAGTAAAAASVVGPVLITVLLLKVSGVSLLERDLEKTKPGFAEYARRTNAFLPWRPRG